jgi:hypothetical protein
MNEIHLLRIKNQIYDFQLYFSSILCPAEKVLSNTFQKLNLVLTKVGPFRWFNVKKFNDFVNIIVLDTQSVF